MLLQLDRNEEEQETFLEAENDPDVDGLLDSSDDEGDEREYRDIARARQFVMSLSHLDLEDSPLFDGSVGDRLPVLMRTASETGDIIEDAFELSPLPKPKSRSGGGLPITNRIAESQKAICQTRHMCIKNSTCPKTSPPE